MTENGGEEDSANTANTSSGLGATSLNEVNHIPATEVEIPEESGWSKHKRVP